MPQGVYKMEKRKGLFKKGNTLVLGKKFPNKKKPFPFTKKHIENMGKAQKGRKHTEITKGKMRESHKGSRNGSYGSCVPEERRKRLREWQIAHPNRKFKDTDIELKVEAELKRRNINYQKQVPLCKIAIVDFYLPEYRIVIECDGDYWHKREKTMIKDEEKTRVLTFNGFNVYRFWGSEINISVEKCINKVEI